MFLESSGWMRGETHPVSPQDAMPGGDDWHPGEGGSIQKTCLFYPKN